MYLLTLKLSIAPLHALSNNEIEKVQNEVFPFALCLIVLSSFLAYRYNFTSNQTQC